MAGTKFKTGYLTDPISFTDMGRQLGADIESGIAKLQDDRLKKSKELDQMYGLSKAQQLSLPPQLSNRYRGGAQLALSAYQDSAARALATSSAAEIARSQRLRSQYEEIVNIGTAVSSQEMATIQSVRNGSFQNLAGDIPDILADYNAYDSSVLEDGKTSRWTISGDTLMFYPQGSDAPVPWGESPLADVNNVYAPPVKWEGSEFMPFDLATTVYTNSLQPQENLYLERIAGTDYKSGEIKYREAYTEIQKLLDNRFLSDATSISEAISMFGYGSQNPNITQFSQTDLARARASHNPALLQNAEASKYFEGSINENGEFVFSLADDQIELTGSDKLAISNMREAKKRYYEVVAENLTSRINRDDEWGKYLEDIAADEQAAKEAIMEAAADSEAAAREFYDRAPAIYGSDDGSQLMTNVTGAGFTANIDGQPANITELVFNSESALIGFRVTSSENQTDKINRLIQQGEDPAVARRIVDEWFNRYNNRIIGLTTTVTTDTGETKVVNNPMFLSVRGGFLNQREATAGKLSGQEFLALSQIKIDAFREGQITTGSLMNRGLVFAEPEPAPTPAAPTPAAPTTPATPVTEPVTVPVDSVAPVMPVVDSIPPAPAEVPLDSTSREALEEEANRLENEMDRRELVVNFLDVTNPLWETNEEIMTALEDLIDSSTEQRRFEIYEQVIKMDRIGQRVSGITESGQLLFESNRRQ